MHHCEPTPNSSYLNSGHGGGYGPGKFDRGCHVPGGRFTETGRFGRMLPYLRSLKSFEPGPDALGAVGGPMDGGSPPPQDTSQNNPRIKAGYTFLGQFIDHDLTLDTTSILEQQIDPGATRNFRTPALELDSVYGLGPKVQPYLYRKDDPGRMLLSPDGFDLPRNSDGTALIGDPRNDENIIVSQLHRLFLAFHNRVYEEATDPAMGVQERFETAQHLVRYHYQWLVLHEFLPRTVGKEAMETALDRMPFIFPEYGDAYMPVEFSVAAYRFGHSQVRPGYLLSAPGSQPVRAAGIFPDLPDAPDSVGDLRGGRPVPEELRIDWTAFFGPTAQASKFIDTRISTALLRLPHSVVSPDGQPDVAVRSLATRNLQRGLDARLPSGQSVAAHFKLPALTEEELWNGVQGGHGKGPLWFYCLREAEVMAGGMRLAGVGAAIVARTFAALLHADKASFLVREPDWVPTFGTGGKFTMSDMVNFTLGTGLDQEDLESLPDAQPAQQPAAPALQPVSAAE